MESHSGRQQISIAKEPLLQCDTLRSRESATGQSRQNWAIPAMSGLPPLATELWTSLEVRFVPNPEVALTRDRTLVPQIGNRLIGFFAIAEPYPMFRNT